MNWCPSSWAGGWLLTRLRSHVLRGWGGGGEISHPPEVPCLEGVGVVEVWLLTPWGHMWGVGTHPLDTLSWHTHPSPRHTHPSPRHTHPLWIYPSIPEGTWCRRYPPPRKDMGPEIPTPLWTDRHLWKHYLPATSFAAVIIFAIYYALLAFLEVTGRTSL